MQREKFYKILKNTVTCLFLLCVFSTPVYSEVQQTFYITAEEIMNAVPVPPVVHFTRKDNKDIATMEKRHFANVNKTESDNYRIARLEEHLLGRTWEFLPTDDRMRKLKLASQRKMLSGTAIPASLRRAGFTPKRIANDSTPNYDDDNNVGILDGFLKLIAPDAFEAYSRHKKKMYEQYGEE